jgi:hypothetical protein
MKESFFNELISKTKELSGLDVIYLIDDSFQVTNVHKVNDTSDYLNNIINLIKKQDSLEEVSKPLFSDNFHTYTLLNESGLILITRLSSDENCYLVVIAGENNPVDLINLFKICKEARQKYMSSTQLSS